MTQGNGLSDAYTATLTRLKAQKGNRAGLGLNSLMWIVHSERPIRAEELCHALGVKIRSTDLDRENVPPVRTLLASCLGLLTVEESSSIVRLVHFTLKEYLSSDPSLFHNPHSTIAEVCLTYLNFRSVWDLSPTRSSTYLEMPLLRYASVYWGEHAARDTRENVKRLALRLLERFDDHISAQLLLCSLDGNWPWAEYHYRNENTGFTGLHAVAYFGLVEIVAAVLEMKEWDFNAADAEGRTALMWAVVRGKGEVVNVLLKLEDVDPNHAGTGHFDTPLLVAAKGGHEGIVKMLLKRKEVDPVRAGNLYGQMPLSQAAKGGHEGVVKMLLEEGVDPNQGDHLGGRTPLLWAAMRGHEGVVKILLERKEIDPNQPDTEYGRTPLSWAAEGGHEGVVKILLEREEIDPNQADTVYGWTPLSWAARERREGAVKLLLEREDVDPEPVDGLCGTPPVSPRSLLGIRLAVGRVAILICVEVE